MANRRDSGATSFGRSNTAEPVEPAISPIAAGIGVRHFDRGHPFCVLETDFGRSAQSKWVSERIGNRLARIFGGKNRLGMKRGRHIEAFRIIVGTPESDVFGLEIRADAFEKNPQVH